MEHSEEEISLTPNPSGSAHHPQNDAVLGFQQHSSSSSSNGDPPDPATSDLGHGAADEGEDLHQRLQNLGLNKSEEEDQKEEEEEEEEEEEVPKSDLEEENEGGEEGVGEKDLSGGEIGSEDGNGKGEEESDGGGGGGGEEESKIGNGSESDNGNDVISGGNGGGVGLERKNIVSGTRKYQYPVRPEAEDCSFYLKTGTCKFGSNCKFNHPVRRKTNQQGAKEKVKEREESVEKPGQSECKYYLRSGGCKFGKACKYNHTRGKTTVVAPAPVLDFNFVGLPIRMGEKECPYYMRTGSCKYGANCRFNHPDPTDSAGGDTAVGYGNGGPVSLQGTSQPTIPSWSSPRSLNEPAPFVPIMLSPTQGVPSQNPEWNGYQAPVYLPERNLPPPPAYVMNNPVTETNIYPHHPPQKQVDEYPERPGQPECTYFLKTGDCKFKSNCKYHHPKRTPMGAPAASCALSDKGLPLRPDQNICTHYSRYGICKFGPACKYDHPAQPISTIPGVETHTPYGNSAVTAEGAGITRRSRSETTIQQLV